MTPLIYLNVVLAIRVAAGFGIRPRYMRFLVWEKAMQTCASLTSGLISDHVDPSARHKQS